MQGKYTSQIKNLRNNYIRFPLDLKPDVLEGFKMACADNKTNPTAEIKKFINRYVSHNANKMDVVPVEVEIPVWLDLLASERGIHLNDVLVDGLTINAHKEEEELQCHKSTE